MVKSCLYFLCFCWIAMSHLESSPLVEATIDSSSSQAHFPLEGTITITHDKQEVIDANSFKMKGEPLEVSFVKDVKMSASVDTLIAIYSFQLPAQKKGLYSLPEISVKVGNQTYQSIPSTYEVNEETASPLTSNSTSTSATIFRLEAVVKGPKILYPGERTKLFYRISYNRSIDLTRSKLPMIHPAHFKKIGDVQVQDAQEKDLTIQDLTQEVEASDLGTFQLGPSSIEGYAYSMKTGQKVYETTLLKSEAPVVTIQVKPFPEPDQPPSFTGALGQIKAEAILELTSPVFIGDSVQFQVKIQGVHNLSELRLPFLQCQPGFSGFFQTSDLPPPAEVKEETKIFHIEMRPLTTLVTHIPSIEVSSFDPVNKKYVIQRTSPLPLKVEAHPNEKIAEPPVAILAELAAVGQWPPPLLTPLEIEGQPIQIKEMKNFRWSHAWIFWLFPLGMGLLLLQRQWKMQGEQHAKIQIPKSEELFKRALKSRSLKSIEGLQLLEKAFWTRLWERGIVPQGVVQIDQLPLEHDFDALRTFLLQLQSLQYGVDKAFDSAKLQQEAKQLFEKI